jgi:pimeloyl-ACP methyl ester carboxylesterase
MRFQPSDQYRKEGVLGYQTMVLPILSGDPDRARDVTGPPRAIDTTIGQNAVRKTKRLTLPDLAIGGVKGIGEGVPNTMRLVTDNALGHIIPETGHWVAEEAPMQVLAALQPFLAPYRKAAAG